MFKLLTEEGIQKVSGEYSLRRLVVILLALILVLVVAIVSLLPSYVLSNIRENEIENRVQIASSIKAKGDEPELEAWLIETNQMLKALSPELDSDRLSDIITQVMAEKIVGVHLLSFSWGRDKDKPVLSVRGLASSRQRLIAFKDNLTSSGNFSAVDLPISNLASDKDIDFQMKLSPHLLTP